MSNEPPSLLSRLLRRKKRSAVSPDVAAVNRLIDEQRIHIVYQPVVDLSTRRIFAHEALCRSDMPELKTPPDVFDAATLASRVGELGRMLRKMAIEQGPSVPLLINIHPNEFSEGWLVQPDDPVFWHDDAVYIEITESVPLTHFEQCHSVMAEVRGKGVMLAVDDLGAGYSNLKYISDLVPEIVKLDRELIAGMTTGSRQFTLTRHIVDLCHDMGARVVAEGIEEVNELEAAIAAHADFGQGFLLARPAFPAPEVHWPETQAKATPRVV